MTYVVECLEQVTGIHFVLERDPKLFRPADEPLYAGNCDKMKALGWVEKYQYADTIEATYQYWKRKLA